MNSSSINGASLTPTAEQQALRATVRRFLEELAPMSRVRTLIESDSGFDRVLWRRMATELGLTSLVLPDGLDGAGAGHVERGIIMEELGRALLPVPYFSSAVLATDLLLAIDEQAARDELLTGIGSGQTLVALAAGEGDRSWAAEPRATVAHRTGRGWVISGRKAHVIDGAEADSIIVYANTDSGAAFFLVDGKAGGMRRVPLTTLDPTRSLATLTFDEVPARTMLTTPDPVAAVRGVLDHAAVALAAEQLGALVRCMELAVEYAKIRVQFGRLIGSFQAVKHGNADSYVDSELATSVVRYAAWVADHQPERLPTAASAARATVSPAFFRVASRTIQLHGGIGYTWEHDAHLYYRRAKSTEYLLGDPQEERRRLAELLDLG